MDEQEELGDDEVKAKPEAVQEGAGEEARDMLRDADGEEGPALDERAEGYARTCGLGLVRGQRGHRGQWGQTPGARCSTLSG